MPAYFVIAGFVVAGLACIGIWLGAFVGGKLFLMLASKLLSGLTWTNSFEMFLVCCCRPRKAADLEAAAKATNAAADAMTAAANALSAAAATIAAQLRRQQQQ